MKRITFKLSRVSGQTVSDDKLLLDLRSVAASHGKTTTVGQKVYRRYGHYDDSTITRRFGSWNSALKAAGLIVSNVVDYSDEDLFANILTLWQHYGRQPRRSELAIPPSRISQSPYQRRFKSWTNALKRFVSFANATDTENAQSTGIQSASGGARRIPRDPSLRLRYQVLQRDRYTCCSCGESPASKIGVELQVDHVMPWSRGGETTLANLQTLCSRCNLGKGAHGDGSD